MDTLLIGFLGGVLGSMAFSFILPRLQGYFRKPGDRITGVIRHQEWKAKHRG